MLKKLFKSNNEKHYEKLMKMEIEKYINRLEELDQDKVYYIKVDKHLNDDDIRNLRRALDDISRGMRWSCPKIIITNQEIVECNENK